MKFNKLLFPQLCNKETEKEQHKKWLSASADYLMSVSDDDILLCKPPADAIEKYVGERDTNY